MEKENNKPSTHAAASAVLAPGTLLQGGKYRIEKVLGQGGFGITYLATMTMLNQKVAIKEFFFKEYCERESSDQSVVVPTHSKCDLVDRFQKKFLKEAKIIFGLHHENIIHLLDVFQENETSYYAMEYIDGTSLSEEIKRQGSLSPDIALGIMKCVCSALSHIHSRHINHLDIKPGNIMLDKKDRRVVLIDFGVSKQYDPETGGSTTTTPVGISEGYSPLEQYNQGGVSSFSPETDIYALGATLFKMLTGKTPPSAIDVSQNGLPPFPPEVPENMVLAIATAMRPTPRKRPHTVEDFWQLLTQTAPVMKAQEEDESTRYEPSAPAHQPFPPQSPGVPPQAPGVPPVPDVPDIPQVPKGPEVAPQPPVPPGVPPAPGYPPARKKSSSKLILGLVIAAIIFIGVVAVALSAGSSSESNPNPVDTSTVVPDGGDISPIDIEEEEGGETTGEADSNTDKNILSVELAVELANRNCPIGGEDGSKVIRFNYYPTYVEVVTEVDEELYDMEALAEKADEMKAGLVSSLTPAKIEEDPLMVAIVNEHLNLRYTYVGNTSGDNFYLEISPYELPS